MGFDAHRAPLQAGQKRTVRLLAESGLPETKTLSTLDEALLPAKVRRQLPALMDGGFVDRAVNVLAFGLPGRGKTHFLAALGRELILSLVSSFNCRRWTVLIVADGIYNCRWTSLPYTHSPILKSSAWRSRKQI